VEVQKSYTKEGERRMRREVDRTSFSLEPEYVQLLGEIARKQRSNRTVELRRMIDAMGGGNEAILPIVERLSRTRDNREFLETLTKK